MPFHPKLCLPQDHDEISPPRLGRAARKPPRVTKVICPVTPDWVGSYSVHSQAMTTKPIVVEPRFILAATVMLRETSTDAAVLVQLRNISLSGCYLETPRPVREGARVRVVLQLAEIRADVCGVVRRRDEKGLGVQFTNGATVEDWKRLESFIKGLHGTVPPMNAAASGAI